MSRTAADRPRENRRVVGYESLALVVQAVGGPGPRHRHVRFMTPKNTLWPVRWLRFQPHVTRYWHAPSGWR